MEAVVTLIIIFACMGAFGFCWFLIGYAKGQQDYKDGLRARKRS